MILEGIINYFRNSESIVVQFNWISCPCKCKFGRRRYLFGHVISTTLVMEFRGHDRDDLPTHLSLSHPYIDHRSTSFRRR